MATNSNILARKIPQTEEPGGLQSVGSQSVGHGWTHTRVRVCVCWTHTHIHERQKFNYHAIMYGHHFDPTLKTSKMQLGM